MEQQFCSPFDDAFDHDKLCNLVSATSVTKEIAESLLSVDKIGTESLEEFEGRMVIGHQKAFFDQIQRKNHKTFRSADKKLKVVNTSKEEVRIERDVLGTLLASDTEKGQPVDIDRALKYPLSPVCAPLCTADGNRRKTTKSQLFAAFDDMDMDPSEAHENSSTYL